jgi:hypothetical protein
MTATPPLRCPQIIGLLASRGGVGCTSLAVHLGCTLADDDSRRVILIDLDLAMGAVDIALDVVPEHRLTDVIGSIDQMDLQLLKSALTPSKGNLLLLPRPAALKDAALVTPDHIQRMLMLLRITSTQLLLDLGKGWRTQRAGCGPLPDQDDAQAEQRGMRTPWRRRRLTRSCTRLTKRYAAVAVSRSRSPAARPPSGPTPCHRGSLNRQKKELTTYIEQRGGVIVHVVERVVPGWLPEGDEDEWIEPGSENMKEFREGKLRWAKILEDAARLALREGAALVARDVDRLVRSTHYRSHHKRLPLLWKAQANRHELLELQDCTLGVPLMTLVDPDAPPEEQKAEVSSIGVKHSTKKNGRPPKKRRGPYTTKAERDAKLPRMRELRQQGMTVRDIGAAVDLSFQSVGRWLKDAP